MGQILSAQTEPAVDLSLNQAENRALGYAGDLSVERSKAQLEKIRFDLGLRSFLPTVSFGYSQNDSIIVDSPDTFDKQIYTKIKQPIFDGGKTARDRRTAELSLKQTFHTLEVDRRSKEEAVWELYKNITLAQKKYDALKQGYGQALKEEKVTAARQSVGEITELDVLDVQVQVRSLEDQVDEALLSLNDQMTQLREQLHFRAGTLLNLTDALDENYNGFEVNSQPETFVRIAESANLDYAKLLIQKQQLETQSEALAWSWLPTVDLETTLSASGATFPLQQPGVNMSVSLHFPAPFVPFSLSLSGGIQGDASRTRGIDSSTEVLSDLTLLTTGTDLDINVRDLQEKTRAWKQSILDQSRDFIDGHALRRQKLQTLRQTLELENRREVLMQARLKIGEIKPGDLVLEQGKLLNATISVWNGVVDLQLQERRFEALLGMPQGSLERLEARP